MTKEAHVKPGELPLAPPFSGPTSSKAGEIPMGPVRRAIENDIDGYPVKVNWADGHHPDDRNALDMQIGVGVPHEHDDLKRPENVSSDVHMVEPDKVRTIQYAPEAPNPDWPDKEPTAKALAPGTMPLTARKPKK